MPKYQVGDKVKLVKHLHKWSLLYRSIGDSTGKILSHYIYTFRDDEEVNYYEIKFDKSMQTYLYRETDLEKV